MPLNAVVLAVLLNHMEVAMAFSICGAMLFCCAIAQALLCAKMRRGVPTLQVRASSLHARSPFATRPLSTLTAALRAREPPCCLLHQTYLQLPCKHHVDHHVTM